MKIERAYVLEGTDEAKSVLKYPFIAECTHSAKWGSSKLQGLLRERFSQEERAVINVIITKSYNWYIRGLPAEIKIAEKEFEIWQKLQKFCVELLL